MTKEALAEIMLRYDHQDLQDEWLQSGEFKEYRRNPQDTSHLQPEKPPQPNNAPTLDRKKAESWLRKWRI